MKELSNQDYKIEVRNREVRVTSPKGIPVKEFMKLKKEYPYRTNLIVETFFEQELRNRYKISNHSY